MKLGIIKERNNPLDQRVVFSPDRVVRMKQLYQTINVKVESSDIRIFSDDHYKNRSIEVVNDLSDCDVFFGINEIPIDYLIPNKTYFFFSDLLQKKASNSALLQALLDKNITFYDYANFVDAYKQRLIDFDTYSGIVAAYNSIRAFGIKFELFKLPKAETLSGEEALIAHLKRLILPPLKFLITGTGRVGDGVKEVLKAIKIKEVSVENYLTKNYTQAVYTQIDVLDYNKRKDGKVLDSTDFFENEKDYESNFERFTKVSDIYISSHFYVSSAPKILTRKMLQAKDCKIKVVADISNGSSGSLACTLRSSTIAAPFYGYWPSENREVDIFHPAAIVVMAVNNLACELPKDASEDFGEMCMEHIIPAFFNGDKYEILQRAKITEKGKLTSKFSYLHEEMERK